jgi:hypothetical protein
LTLVFATGCATLTPGGELVDVADTAPRDWWPWMPRQGVDAVTP